MNKQADNMPNKECKTCKLTKDNEFFGRTKVTIKGKTYIYLRSNCLQCTVAYNRKVYEKRKAAGQDHPTQPPSGE